VTTDKLLLVLCINIIKVMNSVVETVVQFYFVLRFEASLLNQAVKSLDNFVCSHRANGFVPSFEYKLSVLPIHYHYLLTSFPFSWPLSSNHSQRHWFEVGSTSGSRICCHVPPCKPKHCQFLPNKNVKKILVKISHYLL